MLIIGVFILKDCGADCQQRDGLEAAHSHPPPLMSSAVVSSGVAGSMAIKPTTPTSQNQLGGNQQLQGTRSPLPYKQYGPSPNISSEVGRGAGTQLPHNNSSTNDSQPQQQNSSTSQTNVNPNLPPPVTLVNNNKLRSTTTGNGNPTTASRLAQNTNSPSKGDISPTRVRQSTPSPKSDRYSNMNSGDRKQGNCTKSTSESNIRQATSSTKQNSPNAMNNLNYQNKSGGNSNIASDQQPTIKRPRKGSGGVHSKKQQSQQSSHHGNNHMDIVSKV